MPSTTYTITLDPSLTDIYGQKVEPNQTCQFVTKERPHPIGSISGPTGLITMDPLYRRTPTLPILVYNFPSLHLLVHQVDPADYHPQLPVDNSWTYTQQDNSNNKLILPGHKIYDDVIQCKDIQRDEPLNIQVELTNYLQHREEGFGHLLVIIEPTLAAWKSCQGSRFNQDDYNGAQDYSSRQCLITWLQCTELACGCI